MDSPGGRPLAVKLGIKPGHRIRFVVAPEGFEALLAPLPDGVRVLGRGKGLDVIVLFVRRLASIGRQIERLKPTLASSGGLWVAYPKKASRLATDVTFEAVQRAGLEAGLVDNKSCAIDDTWTALRFVYRLRDR